MKTLLPLVSFVLLVMLCAVSSILFLNMDYISSGIMTLAWVIGITFWISARIKQNGTE